MYMLKNKNNKLLYHHTIKYLKELKEMIDFISKNIEKIILKNVEVL